MGEVNNILLQYGDTPRRRKMLELRSELGKIERVLRVIDDSIDDRRIGGNIMKLIISVFLMFVSVSCAFAEIEIDLFDRAGNSEIRSEQIN